MLLTSIQDKRMGAKAFKELYFARWDVEVRINDLKHKVEIENFSGRLENNLYQHFYACVQLLNLVVGNAGKAQEIINYSSDDASKYSYKTNVNHAICVYKDAFIAVVLEPDSVKCIWRLCKIVQLLAKGKTPVRPNRSVPRNPHPRDAHFHHNRKSNA